MSGIRTSLLLLFDKFGVLGVRARSFEAIALKEEVGGWRRKFYIFREEEC